MINNLMNNNEAKSDEIKVHLIDFDDVPAHAFPFFTSYRMFFDEEIKCYGFFQKEEIVAVTAIIPDDPNSESLFMSVGCPIVYVFEVREDLRRKGIGQMSAEILIRDIIDSDTVQLCCSPFVTPFWQKIGFNISFFDQSLYMHRMVLKKEKKEDLEE